MKSPSRANIVSSFTIVKGAMINETYAVFAAWDFNRSKRENLARLRTGSQPLPLSGGGAAVRKTERFAHPVRNCASMRRASALRAAHQTRAYRSRPKIIDNVCPLDK